MKPTCHSSLRVDFVTRGSHLLASVPSRTKNIPHLILPLFILNTTQVNLFNIRLACDDSEWNLHRPIAMFQFGVEMKTGNVRDTAEATFSHESYSYDLQLADHKHTAWTQEDGILAWPEPGQIPDCNPDLQPQRGHLQSGLRPEKKCKSVLIRRNHGHHRKIQLQPKL